MKTPWKESPLDEWSIIGMNHYHQNGQKRLFVAMTKNNTSIVEEGLDDDKLWERLKLKASALKDKTNFEEAADKTFIKLVTMKDKDFDDFIKEQITGKPRPEPEKSCNPLGPGLQKKKAKNQPFFK